MTNSIITTGESPFTAEAAQGDQTYAPFGPATMSAFRSASEPLIPSTTTRGRPRIQKPEDVREVKRLTAFMHYYKNREKVIENKRAYYRENRDRILQKKRLDYHAKKSTDKAREPEMQ